MARLLQFLYYGCYDYDQDYPEREGNVSLADLVPGARRSMSVADRLMPSRRIDLCMFELGDKYCFGTLKSYALNELRNCMAKSLLEMMTADRISHHPELKEVVAEAISEAYNELKGIQSDGAWNSGVGKWLRDDHKLCIMVVDALARSSKNQVCKTCAENL